MVVDFGTLADTLLNGTADKLIEQDIRENAGKIADQISQHGFYENKELGFKVSVNPSGNQHE
jgi:hypothetical protein